MTTAGRDFCDDRIGLILVDIGHRNRSAGIGIGQRGDTPETVAAAGNERDVAPDTKQFVDGKIVVAVHVCSPCSGSAT